jgi:hypothetical protein
MGPTHWKGEAMKTGYTGYCVKCGRAARECRLGFPQCHSCYEKWAVKESARIMASLRVTG